jgi:hypothetical protein
MINAIKDDECYIQEIAVRMWTHPVEVCFRPRPRLLGSALGSLDDDDVVVDARDLDSSR